MVTRATARRMEEEHRGKIATFEKMIQDLAWQVIAIFEKMIQDLAWQVIRAQERAFRGTMTLLFSKLQVEEAKETSWENLEASKPNREEDLNLTTGGRVMVRGEERLPTTDDRFTLPSPVGFWTKACLRSSTYHRRKHQGSPLEESWVLGASDPQESLRRIKPYGVNVIIMYGMKNYRREYDEYYEGYHHGAILMNLENPSKNLEERLGYNSIKTDPLMSSSVTFDPSCYGFGNLDETSLVELDTAGFAFEFDRNSLQHVCTITSTRGKRHTIESEGQRDDTILLMEFLWH
ncbi:hypothetical protein M9H77_03117 [Catharanthus roseus]|uniref:Uncharacterized protein n=1 Tax=Catharanthus roseus TaxID=4058 RepID=A0ACC0CA99_CATRO|nr:hypothetical protein M9H77_03117 [Catharanthus roseus]